MDNVMAVVMEGSTTNQIAVDYTVRSQRYRHRLLDQIGIRTVAIFRPRTQSAKAVSTPWHT